MLINPFRWRYSAALSTLVARDNDLYILDGKEIKSILQLQELIDTGSPGTVRFADLDNN